MPYSMSRSRFVEYAQREDLEIRMDYSGRGMYGSTCPAVIGGLSDFIRFLGAIAADSEECYVTDDFDYLVDRFSKDSMGYDTVFYWPSLTLTEYDYEGEDDE